MIKFFSVLLLFILLASVPALGFAHPGKTDENGGHYDYSTGEYHYHHGYPAHQHQNGICPYEYDDKTDHSSKSPSRSVSFSFHTTAPRPTVLPRATATPRPSVSAQIVASVASVAPIGGIASAAAGAAAYCIVCKVCKKMSTTDDSI